MNPRRCVISLATDRAPFPKALRRLERSVRRVGFHGDVVVWPPGTYPAGCPGHFEVPFAFKPFCFKAAMERGHELVLWLDARCLAIRELDPLFDEIEERGYLLFRNESLILGEWASDLALEPFGLTREAALGLPEVNAAAIGLDARNPVAGEFLDSWYGAARERTAFRGTVEALHSWDDYLDVKRNRSGKVSIDPRVRGHRHDQTVAGILAHRLGMTLTAEGLQDYWPERRRIAPSSRILINRRMVSPWRISLDKHRGDLTERARRPRLVPRDG